MDRYLISGAILLLFFEVAWFLNDFKIVHIPVFDRSENISFKPAVGKIAEIKKGVRRRAQDSIVWEDSNEKDVLYNYDSILTLPQSSAKVALANDTKILMAENTLILIENNEEDGNSKVRLRFAKGDMRALGALTPTEIKTEEWTVDAEAGAELSLRQVDGGKVEVEIMKGEANLKGANTTKSLSQGQVLSLEKDKIVEEKVISKETQWLTKDGLRIYTFNLPAALEVAWSGEADSLWHLRPDRKVETLKLTADEKKKTLTLSSGSHALRLEKNGAISKTLQVSVWEAPIVHLLSPLPRDRVRPGEEVPFSWSGSQLAKSYKLQFSESEKFLNIISETAVDPAFVKLNLKREGPFYWRIIGLDDQGYQIPSLYSNPIFNFKDLLDAPVIKTPKARQPANKWPEGASLWILYFSVASAADFYDVIFEWEPVAGAEHYMIEVDGDGTFRKPITLVKSDSPKFLWTRVPLGKYYWRVAAGRGTTMGRFSPPQLIDLAQVLRDSRVGEEQGISLKPVEVPAPAPAPVPSPVPQVLPKKVAAKKKTTSAAEVKPRQIEKPSPPPPPPPVAVQEKIPEQKPAQPKPMAKKLSPPPPFQRQYDFDIFLGAGWDQKSLGAPTDLTIKFSDFMTRVVGFNLRATMPGDKSFIYAGEINSNSWKPKNATEFPAQNEVAEMNWRNNIYWEWSKTKFGLGVVVNSISLMERAGLVDQVKFTPAMFLGMGVRLAWGNFTHQLTWSSESSERGASEIWLGNNYTQIYGRWNLHILLNYFSRSGKSEPSSSGILLAPAVGVHW